MTNSKSEYAVKELFKFIPGTIRVLNLVAESYEDEVGLAISKQILKDFEQHNKKEGVQSASNELMIIEGLPFYEQLDFTADKLNIRTFTYVPDSESSSSFAEKARELQEQVIRHLVGESGAMITFPKSRSPKMITPRNDIETLKYRTWGAVAMGIKLGIPVYVYVPSIHKADRFLGPLVSRGKVLSEGHWGAWVLMSATVEDVSAEVKKVLMKNDGEGLWVEGVPSRPNFFQQN